MNLSKTLNFMQKTTFKIAKMDCPSEEQMIRMKLNDLTHISTLEFDIPKRQLTVFHTGNHHTILERLESLKFDTSLIDSVSVQNTAITTDHVNHESKSLWLVLSINLFFFALELTTGFISNSMGLVSDSLDMLADSIVYALALLAVGATVTRKKKITSYAGYLQLTLACFGLIEVIRRFVGNEAVPAFQTMIIISVLALIGNGLCLYILQKSKSREIHMQASMIFTSNDVIVNLSVILAGGLVYFSNSKYPDLIIGAMVFLIVARGAFKILKL